MTVTDELADLHETERQRWGRVLDHFGACKDCPTAGPRGCQEAQKLRAQWRPVMDAVQDAAARGRRTPAREDRHDAHPRP